MGWPPFGASGGVVGLPPAAGVQSARPASVGRGRPVLLCPLAAVRPPRRSRLPGGLVAEAVRVQAGGQRSRVSGRSAEPWASWPMHRRTGACVGPVVQPDGSAYGAARSKVEYGGGDRDSCRTTCLVTGAENAKGFRRVGVHRICFDRSPCGRYAQTLCLGCALASVRAINRMESREWPP